MQLFLQALLNTLFVAFMFTIAGIFSYMLVMDVSFNEAATDIEMLKMFFIAALLLMIVSHFIIYIYYTNEDKNKNKDKKSKE